MRSLLLALVVAGCLIGCTTADAYIYNDVDMSQVTFHRQTADGYDIQTGANGFVTPFLNVDWTIPPGIDPYAFPGGSYLTGATLHVWSTGQVDYAPGLLPDPKDPAYLQCGPESGIVRSKADFIVAPQPTYNDYRENDPANTHTVRAPQVVEALTSPGVSQSERDMVAAFNVKRAALNRQSIVISDRLSAIADARITDNVIHQKLSYWSYKQCSNLWGVMSEMGIDTLKISGFAEDKAYDPTTENSLTRLTQKPGDPALASWKYIGIAQVGDNWDIITTMVDPTTFIGPVPTRPVNKITTSLMNIFKTTPSKPDTNTDDTDTDGKSDDIVKPTVAKEKLRFSGITTKTGSTKPKKNQSFTVFGAGTAGRTLRFKTTPRVALQKPKKISSSGIWKLGVRAKRSFTLTVSDGKRTITKHIKVR